MPLGRKIADVYAELHLDKDQLGRAMAAASGEMGADADRLGRNLGDRMSKGIADRVEALSARLAKARLAEQKATDAVKLAEARLNEARDKGNVVGSRMLALEQKLSQAQGTLALAHDNTTKAVTKHADAEKRLAADLENMGKQLGPAADRVGRDSGDKLAMGMRLAVIRNSPLIVAGIGAALAAGAPVAIAGATTLFAGIGVVAAAQSQKVQTVFAGLWDEVKTGTQDAASSLVPVLERVGGAFQQEFSRIQPMLRQVFEASGPYIEGFTRSINNVIDTVMPSFVRTIQGASPVMAGLDSFLESIGTGLAGFFDQITAHAPAAGQAFAALGQIIEKLLPFLGEILGRGAELASVVLPPLAKVVGLVADAFDRLGPILPAVLTGFTAFKAVGAVSGILEGFGRQIGRVSAVGGKLGSMAESASSGLSKVGRTVPLVGAALAAIVLPIESVREGMEHLTGTAGALYDKMREGGAAGDQASAALAKLTAMAKEHDSQWGNSIGGWNNWTDAVAKAKQQAQEYEKNLPPLQRAQEEVTRTQNDYLQAVQTWGAKSGQAIAASFAYRDAKEKEKTTQDQLNRAIHGVTQAMIDQADQAMASIDSTFALQHAQNQQRDAEIALKDAIKSHGSASVEAHDAEQAYAESIYRTAEAAARLKADQSGLASDSLEYKQILDSQLLAALQRVEGSLSGPARSAVHGFIATLQAAGVTSDATGAKLDNLGAKRPTPRVSLNASQYNAVSAALQRNIGYIGRLRASPIATLYARTGSAEYALNRAARDRVSYVYQRTISSGPAGLGGASYWQALGGIMHAFAGGGFEKMAAGTAQIVPPKTLRVIGDRMRDDEAYIPINKAARSKAILSQTASRMGYGLVPNADGNTVAARAPGAPSAPARSERPIIVNLSFPGMIGAPDQASLRKAAVILRDEIRKVERAAR